MIEAKDILHYYLGSKFKYTWLDGCWMMATLESWNIEFPFVCGTAEYCSPDTLDKEMWYEIDVFKDGKMELILTSTIDMTDRQMHEYKALCYKIVDLKDDQKIIRYSDTPESMHYLFRNGIDAFDLIENRQAIDAKTLINNQTPQP